LLDFFGDETCARSVAVSVLLRSLKRSRQRMLYVGFGSISGVVHLIARLSSIGRAVAMLVIVAMLLVPIR